MSLLFKVIRADEVVSAVDLDALGDDEFEAAFRRLLAVEQVLAASKLACLDSARRRNSHAAHGFRDTGAWVASLAGERVGAVRRDVALAQQVAAAPVVAAALADGSVSKAQAGQLVAAAALPAEVQRRLVERADVLSVERLGQAVREAQFDHGLVPADPRPNAEVSRTDDGGGTLTAHLDALGFEILDTALHAAVEQMGLPTDVPMGERRAAALVAIARHFLERTETPTTRRTGLAHVLALIPVETLLATTGGSATLASGAVISGDVARQLACDAGISRVITRGPSEPLDVGRTTRSIPSGIARAVMARDRHCTHAGCHAPPAMCEIHHTEHWARGGTTAHHNLRLLCWYHHQREHETTAHRRRSDAA